MTFDAQQHIPLTKAYLCQDCDEIGNSSMQCPACASEVLLSLAVVFDRKRKAETLAAELLLFPARAARSPKVLLYRARTEAARARSVPRIAS
jgi:hypothetical protein